MKKGRLLGAICIALTLIVAVVLVALYLSSYNSALRKAGIVGDGSVIVDLGIDDNGSEYRVVAEYTSGNNARIAYLSKNAGGFWCANQISETPTSAGLVSMGWTHVASIRRFAVSDASVVEFETHALYCGNNATKRIVIAEEDLPHNVAVNIHQAGGSYMLHFVAYGDSEILNEIDVSSLLRTAGSIQ